MDELQAPDSQDTELPDTIKNWVAAQDKNQQSMQPPPAVAQMLKAQQPTAPVAPPQMDPAVQAQQILQPQGTRQDLAANLLRPSIGQTIGNAFAGLGDAIGNSHGGHTEFLKNSMQSQRDRANTLLDSADKDSVVNKEKFALTQSLMKKDPRSLISQQTQEANKAILMKTLGIDGAAVAKMSAEQIEALGGKPIDMLKAENEGKTAMEMAKYRGETAAIAAKAQETAEARAAEEERYHRSQSGHEEARLDADIKDKAAERSLQRDKDRLEADKTILAGSKIPFVGPSHHEKQAAQRDIAGIGQSPVAPAPQFATEADAAKANLPHGSRVVIGGVSGTWSH